MTMRLAMRGVMVVARVKFVRHENEVGKLSQNL